MAGEVRAKPGLQGQRMAALTIGWRRIVFGKWFEVTPGGLIEWAGDDGSELPGDDHGDLRPGGDSGGTAVPPVAPEPPSDRATAHGLDPGLTGTTGPSAGGSGRTDGSEQGSGEGPPTLMGLWDRL